MRLIATAQVNPEHSLSLGSIVQNGKFSAAAWLLVSTLKNVDFLQIIFTQYYNYTNDYMRMDDLPFLTV